MARQVSITRSETGDWIAGTNVATKPNVWLEGRGSSRDLALAQLKVNVEIHAERKDLAEYIEKVEVPW